MWTTHYFNPYISKTKQTHPDTQLWQLLLHIKHHKYVTRLWQSISIAVDCEMLLLRTFNSWTFNNNANVEWGPSTELNIFVDSWRHSVEIICAALSCGGNLSCPEDSRFAELQRLFDTTLSLIFKWDVFLSISRINLFLPSRSLVLITMGLYGPEERGFSVQSRKYLKTDVLQQQLGPLSWPCTSYTECPLCSTLPANRASQWTPLVDSHHI